jgi:hypothetical protein
MAHIHTRLDGSIELHDVWSYEDVRNAQECREGKNLTDNQCKRVLEFLCHYHDANEGINWEVIEVAIDQVLKEA